MFIWYTILARKCHARHAQCIGFVGAMTRMTLFWRTLVSP